MPSPSPGFDANLQRGALLRQQGRYAEAATFIGRAIEADPERAPAYVELASCYNEWPGHQRQALQAIDRAIALEPSSARIRGLKGWILVCQRKFKWALEVSHEAVALDPLNITALNALTNAYTKLGKWKDAELTARRILALNAHDIPALNLLAQALRLQGRTKESREIVAGILARLPNNAFGHTNAGYGALQAGDHLRANEHFLNALRMEPHSEYARRGLLHSLRARVWIFRQQYRLAAFARQPATFLRALILVGIVLAVSGLVMLLQQWLPMTTNTMACFVVVYLFLSASSQIFGDIFLLFDPVGRHALGPLEKRRAVFVALALGVIILTFIVNQFWGGLAALIGCLLFFGLSIHYPQIKDRWSRWRERRREAEADPPA